MTRQQHSGVFLMEMIAVILFFILCAAVCIQTFVKADFMSRKASDLNQGVLIAQSVAEVWKAEGPEGLQKRFQAEASGSAEGYVMGFDMAGQPCETANAVFDVRAELFLTGEIKLTISRGGEEVYTLRAVRHEPVD